MEGRMERLDLLHQRVGEALPRNVRNAGNVVDRLFRIELGALAADLVEDVDEMRLHVEKAELEGGEQTAGSGANNQHIGFDRVAHVVSLLVVIGWTAPGGQRNPACLANGDGSGKA